MSYDTIDPLPWDVGMVGKDRGGGFSIISKSPDVSGGGVYSLTPHELDKVCARVESKETAERIVACVNACAGLDNEVVEAIPAIMALVAMGLIPTPPDSVISALRHAGEMEREGGEEG